MRLICPHCMSGVTVPDDTAGKDATCPNCGKSFPTPARYSAAVAADPPRATSAAAGAESRRRRRWFRRRFRPRRRVTFAARFRRCAGRAGFCPPTSPRPQARDPDRGRVHEVDRLHHLAAGGRRGCPAVLLTAGVGAHVLPVGRQLRRRVGGVLAAAVGGDFGAHPTAITSWKKPVTIPDGWMDKVRSDWNSYALLPVLFLAIAFAWADRGLHCARPAEHPAAGETVAVAQRGHRRCAGLALFLLLLQVLNGFGMERAIRQALTEQFAERGRRPRAVRRHREVGIRGGTGVRTVQPGTDVVVVPGAAATCWRCWPSWRGPVLELPREQAAAEALAALLSRDGRERASVRVRTDACAGGSVTVHARRYSFGEGTAMSHVHLAAGTRLGDFEIEGCLGGGHRHRLPRPSVISESDGRVESSGRDERRPDRDHVFHRAVDATGGSATRTSRPSSPPGSNRGSATSRWSYIDGASLQQAIGRIAAAPNGDPGSTAPHA